MTKNKTLIAVGLTSLIVFGVAFASTSSLKSLLTRGANNTVWVHYSKVNASTTAKGIKEYWVSCSTSEHQFTAPSGVTIRDGGTPSRAFIDALDVDDDRLIDPYTETIDFENGKNSYISNFDYFTSIEVVDGEGIGGSKALRAINNQPSNTDSHLKIDKGFLDYVFSDPNAKSLSFYAKGTKVTNNFRHIEVGSQYVNGYTSIISCYENNNNGYGITNEYKQFFLTRGVYSQMNDSDWFIQYGEITSSEILYLDNFSISYTDYYQFKKNSFEYGGLFLEENSQGSGKYDVYRLRSTPGNQADFNIINRVGAYADTNASVSFDYVNYTDGYRSIKLTKPNGEFDYHVLGNYGYSSIPSDGGVCFDIYSSINVNASFDEDTDGYYEKIGNYQDGFAGNKAEGSKVIHNGRIEKDTWYTFYMPKPQIASNGRFFVINGGTPGSFSMDNVRIFDATYYNNNGVKHLEDSMVSLTTTLDINKFDSIAIDHVKADITSFNGKNFNISSSLLTEGYHEVIATYYNNNSLICEHMSVEAVFMTTENAKSVTISYGNNGYYSLSGYSGVYRMMVENKEVPFEIDGSSYLIPNAALMELLPTVNNQKTSGVLKLKLFTTSTNYVLPLNITVSGTSTIKTITNYVGDGIGTHAYSSTSSYTSRTDYEKYTTIEKIAEYQNIGLQIMYEQSLGVGLYETALCDAMNHLLSNAQKLNQKVMVVDYALTLLSKYNRSIINEPLYETVDGYGNPQTSTSAANPKYNNPNVPLHGSDYMFVNTTELDTFVEHRLKIYINNPHVYGITIGDEQTYDMLNGGYKDVMASIHRVLAKLNRQDFFINSNLNPMTSQDWRYIGGTTATSTSYSEANYKTYLDAYVTCSGLNYLQFDIYPFADSGKGGLYEGKGINKYYMKNLLIAAEYCKTNNLDLYFVTQSVTYYGTRILDRKDIAWINNMALGVGVKHISYFVYCVRKASATGSETWLEDSAPLDSLGNRTDLYYYFQSAIAEINQFSSVISAFDYKWNHLYRKTIYSTANVYSNVYTLSNSSYGELSSVSTSKDWTFVTGLESKTDSKKMYMVQNVYNNFDNELLQTVTLTFNATYQYAVIYESGLPRVVNMNSKTLELKLSAGRAAFVMVF